MPDTPRAISPQDTERNDHGPVMLTEVEKALCAASADPGRYVGRGDDYDEPLYQWQVRAIVKALRSLPLGLRMEAMGMQPFRNAHLDHLYESGGRSAPSLWREADA